MCYLVQEGLVSDQERAGAEKPAVSQQALLWVSRVDVTWEESWGLTDLLEVRHQCRQGIRWVLWQHFEK